jgi:chitin disaccharide deacetylase
MSRILALCADGYGMSPASSTGIERLARARRLTAISCVTNSPHWTASVEGLAGLPETVDVGLHLNFTQGLPLSGRLKRRWRKMPGWPRLVLQSHLRLLPHSEMRNEVHAQLAAFNRAFEKPPCFIDGHRHVHHLPGLRDVILDMAEHIQPLPAVRNTGRVLGPGAGLSRWLIAHTGGRALEADLVERVIAHNPALLGVYRPADGDYRSLFQRWLDEIPAEGALLFCQPAEPPSAHDRPAASAERELAYLESSAFDADLAAAGVKLGRVWRTVAAAADVPAR